MAPKAAAKLAVQAALALTVLSAVGLSRLYLTTPELRKPAHEIIWHLLPLVALTLIVLAQLVLLASPRQGKPGSKSNEQPL